ncbi:MULTISPECIES: hypothetical protein [unclassified Myroides]|uniref:hypothetical protein n=1 Tax=unclassified Myroides TaxID=2642485 RepID=UPI0015F79317|nr:MULTISPECIES: hypothetical protein [unclassified Myroides]MBB1148908.1 hypothetical protein [Myroides sp. NP-2]MDM1408098.1 hypothetical protein [Myroides sp. DF42-4-2]
MKKFYSILIGLSLLTIGGGLLSSCSSSDDNDFSSDPSYKGPTYVSLTLPDTTRIETEKFIATLDANGEFRLLMDDIEGGNHIFGFTLLRFQEGNFPTNLNVIEYMLRTGEVTYDTFSSLDPNDPRRNNGMIKISKIDKESMLVSGTFSSAMVPSPLNQSGMRTFTVSGEFKNIPYKRIGLISEYGFVYASLNGNDINDLMVVSDAKGDVVDGRVVIAAESKPMRKRAIKFSFPKEAAVGNYKYDQVQVEYISENGVKYFSNAEDQSLAESVLKIEQIGTLPGIPNRATYKGKFTFKLKSKDGRVLTLNFGDFSADISLKEVVTPGPGPGPGEGGGPIEL